jgi:hypothetical protein
MKGFMWRSMVVIVACDEYWPGLNFGPQKLGAGAPRCSSYPALNRPDGQFRMRHPILLGSMYRHSIDKG